MSKDEEKEGLVIDVVPESETDTVSNKPSSNQPSDDEAEPMQSSSDADTAAPKSPSPANSSSKLPLMLAGLSLVLVAGSFVFAYQYTQQATNDFAAINQRLSASLEQQAKLSRQLEAAQASVAEQNARMLEQQRITESQRDALDSAREDFAAQERLLDEERLRMESREAELRATVADVHKRVGSSNTQWMVAEADYLMRVANARMTLARDADTAREALLLADQRLRDTRDPTWHPVREQLAREIAAIDSANLPDTAGLAAQLGAMSEQIPQLRLARATLGGPARTSEQPQEARSERTWDTLLDDLWVGFKDTVRIRRNDKPVQAMLAPDQQFFLYENLRLQLESARLAVARSDAKLFRDSLSNASAWLSNHFDMIDAPTSRLHKQTLQMMAINIRPALPDISQSLRTLEMRQKINADLARSLPALETSERASAPTAKANPEPAQ